jgi:hypothetical protein
MQDILPPSPFSIIQRNVIMAVCFGAFPEWQEFMALVSLATYFSTLLFPQKNPVGSPSLAAHYNRGYARHHSFTAYGTIASIIHVHP